MKCPACGRQLQEMVAGGVTVDICKGGCGGIWFDRHELEKFDEPHEEAGQELLDVERDESLTVDHTERRKCPKCDDVVMMRHFFTVKHQVEVDECPGCGGIWLDTGELGQIRSLYTTEEERREAAETYFKDAFGTDLTVQKIACENAPARRAANVLRFLAPSSFFWGGRD